MLRAALARMADVFPHFILSRGQDYQKKGYVLNVRLSDGLIKARVKGDSNQIYNVHFDLKNWPGSSAQCGCSYHTNCEHAAACLFELQVKENQNIVPSLPSLNYSVDNEVFNAEDVEWYSRLDDHGHDFFSYQLGILIEGKPFSIVPLVTDLITRWDEKTLDDLSDNLIVKLPLGEGRTLKIKLGRVKPLLRILLQYSLDRTTGQQDLSIKRYQLLLMLEAEQALVVAKGRWQATEALREKLQQLANVNSLPEISIPAGLKAALRDYQQQGLNWLQCLSRYQFGGVLADDMGLGKTVQTLALLQYEKEQGRLKRASLILAPTSLMGNWHNEAKRFTPDLNVLIFHGTERHRDDFDDYDLVVSTYGLVQRDKKRFLNYPFYYLILDEAQFIKNARAKTTQIVQQFQATHRLCLSGTPLENHLGELWSLFHFLMPGFLGSARQFKQIFRTPIEKYGDHEKKELLTGRIQPFLLRRTKNEVASELPPKTIMTRIVELTGSQRDLYEAIRLSMEKKVRDAIAKQGLGKSHIILLDALLKLRQICCDPRLLSLPQAEIAYGQSAKLEALMVLLENLMEEGRSVLVFSQFTSMLQLIEKELQKRRFGYLKLTGNTRNRSHVVQDFQQGKAAIFLISLKAGGTGLNLTRADTVIHYDPWWNPAVEDQATDRSHRIGQENPVFVYKLITEGTVEEAILRMQEKKRTLAEGILCMQDSGKLILTEDDIAAFFSPL
nr:DEAD/DEAH box helicase [Legionella nagasakiensis]